MRSRNILDSDALQTTFFSRKRTTVDKQSLDVPLRLNNLLGKTMDLFVGIVIGFETILTAKIRGR